MAVEASLHDSDCGLTQVNPGEVPGHEGTLLGALVVI
jgi:hypothetical protein